MRVDERKREATNGGRKREREKKRKTVNANVSILVKIANSGLELIMEELTGNERAERG